MAKTRARLDLGWILVILLAVFALAPLTYPGFFEARTGFLPPFNVEHLSEAPNWGRMAGPLRGEAKLPYLLVSPISALTGSGVTAIKWGYGLAFLLGALGIYAWARHWSGRRGALLASVVYTYLPWHLSAVYVRGAYAEAWLWAFLPFIFWAIDRLAEKRLLAGIVVGLAASAAALWTQPGLFLLSLPLLATYAAFTPDDRSRWPVARAVVALVLPLFLLWAIARLVPASGIPFSSQFLNPFQLLSAAWGADPGSLTISFQLGLAAVGLAIVALALLARDWGATPRRLRSASLFWLIVLLLLLFLTLAASSTLWHLMGLNAFLAHPWQLLALTGLPLAFLSGSVVGLDRRLAELPALAGLIALVILASYPYLAPRFTQVDPGPEPVAMFQPLEAEAPQFMILDYQVQAPTEITPTLTVTLTWQAVEPVAQDYTVFLHLLAEGDAKAAQRDTRPCQGECPTNSWQPGQLIVDRYQLGLDAAAPPPPYRLAMGLYLLDSGERAAVTGRDDGTVVLDVP